MRLPKNSDVKRLVQMLSTADKGAGAIRGIGGILSHLFRCILRDKDINPQVWGRYMHDYLTNPENGVPDNTRDRTSERGNLNKELSRAEMTWKVFCKAMRFVKVRKMVLIIVIETEDGRQSMHTSAPVVLSRKGVKTQNSNDEILPENLENKLSNSEEAYHHDASKKHHRKAGVNKDGTFEVQ